MTIYILHILFTNNVEEIIFNIKKMTIYILHILFTNNEEEIIVNI